MTDTPPAPWALAEAAAALFAVDPAGLGGVLLHALPGPVRDRWLALLPADLRRRPVPLHVTDERLLGGLDLPATLRAGRPVAERGILAAADGGIVVLAMAERLPPGTVGRIAAVLDGGVVRLERDGIALETPTRFGVLALDESMADDEQVAPALRDRLAFPVDLTPITRRDADGAPCDAARLGAARALLPEVVADDAVVEALCATALALGIASLRAPILALRAALAAAALAGRAVVSEADTTLAARLVLAPRATVLPAAEPEPAPPEPPPEPPPDAADRPDRDSDAATEADRPLDDVVLAAAQAAIPAGLLAALTAAGAAGRPRTAGRSGAPQKAGRSGRPAGIRRGAPRAGLRLNVVATLRAAAPWQRLRGGTIELPSRVQVRAEDFHITRYRQRAETTTIFVVDASGSAALNRLAEAKGAVELLLAECYIRRDQVAVLAFRGRTAELLLPPTRSLVRAKRALAGLPGGGGTPLAAALDAAAGLADAVRRRGQTPALVVLTDGRANIARDGSPGRARAEADALAAARAVRAAGFGALLVDTGPRPQPAAAALAAALGARYLPLPEARAGTLLRAVQGMQGRA